jgi:hypothetical protein
MVWLFLRGAESQMGYTSQQNQPLGVIVVAKMLEMVVEEVEDQEEQVAQEYMKFGAAGALAVCALLQLDLAGLWHYINLGREGKIPLDLMKTGRELSGAPHIIVTLIGEFNSLITVVSLLRPFFYWALQNCSFFANFWPAQLAEDNANNSSSSSTTLSNLSINKACCNNDVSRGSIPGPEIV